MKRWLLYLILVACFAIWLGTLMAEGPGYVLIAYNGVMLQTGLWVFLTGLFALGVIGYLFQKMVYLLFNLKQQFYRWQLDRQVDQSLDHTYRGLIFLQAGNVERARKYLLSGAEKITQPAFSLISLAKAVDACGDATQRENYLRQALEADPEARQAVAVAAAEMARDRGDWQQVTEQLQGATDNPLVLRLKKEAMQQLVG